MGKAKDVLEQQKQKLKALTARIQKAKKDSNIVPVDEATLATGKKIAHEYVSYYLHLDSIPLENRDKLYDRQLDEWREQGYAIFKIIGTNAVTSSAVAVGFFQEVAKDARLFERIEKGHSLETFMFWWLQVINDCEDAGYLTVLSTCIRNYVLYAQRVACVQNKAKRFEKLSSLDDSLDSFHLAKLYQKLLMPTSKQGLVEQCVQIAFQAEQGNIILHMVSSLYNQVMNDYLSTNDADREILFQKMQSLVMLESRQFAMRTTSNDIWEIVDWIIMVCNSYFDTRMTPSRLITGFEFVKQLNEVVLLAMVSRKDTTCISSRIRNLIQLMVHKALPLCTDPLDNTVTVPSISPILQQVLSILSLFSSKCEGEGLFCEVSILFDLAMICLSLQADTDAELMLKLISITATSSISSYDSAELLAAHSILYVLERIFQAYSNVGDISNTLNVIQGSFSNDNNHDDLTQLLQSKREKKEEREVLLSQCEKLLTGLSLICATFEATKSIPINHYSNLGQHVEQYPHLGRRALPVLVGVLERSIAYSSTEVLLSMLKFLCSITHDPSCAHEVWSILSSLTSSNVPIKIQSMVIRLYPILCSTNHRLYARICESLGRYIIHPNITLKIAASASLCDLAKEDLIRDVSEIIGWVQGFLVDEECLLSYYAIRTLHYLIEAEELDFSMVIKVLSKKLVSVDDVDQILTLEGIVIEALVQLMGLGEAADSSSSDEEESDDDSEIVISQQEQSSIDGLLGLAKIFSEAIGNGKAVSSFDKCTMVRVLDFIYISLGKYSFDKFGVTNEMVRGETGEIEEYNVLKDITKLGFTAIERCPRDNNIELISSYSILMRKLVTFEEDSLGPSLWSSKSRVISKPSNLKEALDTLPTSREDTATSFFMSELGSGTIEKITVALECLLVLSLPSQFAGLIGLAATKECLEERDFSTALLNTLVAQLQIERRAAEERRHFLNLSSEFSKISEYASILENIE
ncbi:hypothetical protein CTEN210_12539 [Chaetoceros tenuissimus]|uniref:DUF3730 domain-containing protein n=1 Tax=Chaetoceros tenuissimus TaxID=426638 RepID=A0AAD3D1H6_9STRA|nr:hypothetical protein CTEN210_12539 [Chaetoceros tenuissimus]